MTCYKPLIREVSINEKWEIAADGHKYKKGRIFPFNPEIHKLQDFMKFDPIYTWNIIPCRKCIGCKLDYARDWANRGFLEAKKTPEHNYFVTLTYDEEHLPIDHEITTSEGKKYENDGTWKGNLRPKDLSKFIHDIRQYLERTKNHTGVKYIACGEYGKENERPHYHIIFFNLPLDSDTFYNSRVKNGEYYYQNKIIEKYWKKGISNITHASWNTIAYVGRYVTKKIYGQNAEDIRASKGQIAEFIRMSKGVGKNYWIENKEKILETDSITIKNGKGVHITKPPKYFTRLLKNENPEEYEKIKNKREKDMENMNRAKDQNSSYTRYEELQNQRRSKEIQAGTLKRTL